MSEDGAVWVRAQELLDAADEMRAESAAVAANSSAPSVVDVNGGAGTLYIAALIDGVTAFPGALATQGDVMANGVTLAVWDAIRADTLRPGTPTASAGEGEVFEFPNSDVGCECD